jgi:hypothetical protein
MDIYGVRGHLDCDSYTSELIDTPIALYSLMAPWSYIRFIVLKRKRYF